MELNGNQGVMGKNSRCREKGISSRRRVDLSKFRRIDNEPTMWKAAELGRIEIRKDGRKERRCRSAALARAGALTVARRQVKRKGKKIFRPSCRNLKFSVRNKSMDSRKNLETSTISAAKWGVRIMEPSTAAAEDSSRKLNAGTRREGTKKSRYRRARVIQARSRDSNGNKIEITGENSCFSIFSSFRNERNKTVKKKKAEIFTRFSGLIDPIGFRFGNVRIVRVPLPNEAPDEASGARRTDRLLSWPSARSDSSESRGKGRFEISIKRNHPFRFDVIRRQSKVAAQPTRDSARNSRGPNFRRAVALF